MIDLDLECKRGKVGLGEGGRWVIGGLFRRQATAGSGRMLRTALAFSDSTCLVPYVTRLRACAHCHQPHFKPLRLELVFKVRSTHY
jgi:hypothetical protein